MNEKNKKIFILFLTVIVAFSTVIEAQAMDFKKSYEDYKKSYLQAEGRVIDPQRDNITTSEAQAYMLLQSVLMNDRGTFDHVLDWTQKNLQRDDYLLSWLWGKDEAAKYRILDKNPASDADIDAATALLIAHKKWNDKKYLEEALNIIRSIWIKETRQIGVYHVLMPGVEQANSDLIEINPSYFAPYSFKLFKKYDKTHDWEKLVYSSYHYLEESCNSNKTGLPSDWALLVQGKIKHENEEIDAFSYDAVRVFPRVFLDYATTKDQRAKTILDKSAFFVAKWQKDKAFYTNYLPSGALKDKNEYTGSIAALLPALYLVDKETADEIYKEKILKKFGQSGFYESKNDYYGRNLVWFGLYLNQKFKGVK